MTRRHTLRHIAAARAVLALALLVGAAGCSDGAVDVTDPATSRTSTPTSTPPTPSGTSSPEGGVPPFTAGTRPADGGHGSGNGLGLVAVRAARHRGFDRVVFELGGTGTPGWRVEYTTRPRWDGSGDPVALRGTAFLQVVLRGLGLPYDTGLEPYGDDTTRVPGTGTLGVAEIAPGGVFEGDQGAFIGLTGAPRPFRVFTLADPARVVVDVRDK